VSGLAVPDRQRGNRLAKPSGSPGEAGFLSQAPLLVALDVHPRVAMTILRHSKIAVTMDIYSQVSSASTKEALKRLGNEFGEEVL